MGSRRRVYSPYTKKLQQQQRERELQRIEQKSQLERRIFIGVSLAACCITGLIFLYIMAYPV